MKRPPPCKQQHPENNNFINEKINDNENNDF